MPISWQIDKLMTEVSRRYGVEGVRVMSAYNPDTMYKDGLSEEECYFGEHPTLAEMAKEFDRKYPVAWLMAHLHDLSEYSGARGKLTGHVLQQCAVTIAMTFYFLKCTELMLFFMKFKSGAYGRFYGDIDPLIITESIRAFCGERMIAYEKHEQQQREQAEREHRKEAISYEEWERRNQKKK